MHLNPNPELQCWISINGHKEAIFRIICCIMQKKQEEKACQCGGLGARADDAWAHLFDAVWVDRGLWLKYAHWLCFGSALRHLPDLLGYEIVDTVKGLHSALDQTHSLSRSCQRQRMREARFIFLIRPSDDTEAPANIERFS